MNQRQFYGIVALVLLSLTAIAVLPVVAFRYLGFSETGARLLGSSIAAASTIGLVLVTSVTVWQNRQMMEKQEKELKKGRKKEFVEDIIRPSKKIARKNMRYSTSAPHYVTPWTKGAVEGIKMGDGSSPRQLRLICDREDIDDSELKSFESDYPDVYEFMEYHDRLLSGLQSISWQVYRQGSVELFEKYEVPIPDEKINEKMKSDIYDLILGDPTVLSTNHGEVKPRQWQENKQDILKAAKEVHGEELQEFWDNNRWYTLMCQKLVDRLDELRTEISDEYWA